MKHKNNGWKKDGLDLVDSLNLTKAEKKKLEKLDKISIHLQALFAAVEHSQVEKARTILATTDVDVNSANSDGFLALDIAVLTNNLPLVKMLQGAGATENPSFCGGGERCAEALDKLLKEAGDRVDNLTAAVLSNTSQSAPSSPIHRQMVLWRRRHRLLNAMKVGLQRLRPPDPPPALAMEIVASDSVCLRFSEPEDQNLAVCTRVKAQWSLEEDFSVVLGERELLDIRAHQLTVNGLAPGSRYYFRLACGNIKGYGDFVNSQPPSGVPSVWRDVDGRKPRFLGRPAILDDLFDKLLTCRPEDASEIRDMEHTTEEDNTSRRVQKKSAFKQLFAAAPKFEKEKLLKRGLHLACIFYNEDKILVTNEEHLPIIEVDENSPAGPIHAEFNWLTKVACTWKDVKSLRQDMEKLSTSPQIELRSKILGAVSLLQSALGVQELGQFYYKHLRDGCGTVLLSVVNKIKNPKSIQSLSVKWMPMNKLQRKSANVGGGIGSKTGGDDSSEGEPSVGDLLLASVHDQIMYDQRNRVPLPPGLYLGYIKLQSSMDLLSILVPERTPNIFPHTKIRENAHVSSEEWDWLQTLSSFPDEGKPDGTSSGSADQSNSAVHAIFERQVAVALKKLFAYLGVSDSSDTACSHRIYTREVVEVSPDVAFVMVLPSPENVCSIPGQTHELLTERRDFISVPVPIFEMAHLRTYQRDFVSRYCRLFSILESDQFSAQQANREAFSNEEVDAAKRRLNRLQEVQTLVDNTWKGARWIMDILSYARDKTCPPGSLSTAVVLSRNRSTPITADTSALVPTSAHAGLSLSSSSGTLPLYQHSPEAAARHLAAGLMMRGGGGKNAHPPPPPFALPALPPKPGSAGGGHGGGDAGAPLKQGGPNILAATGNVGPMGPGGGGGAPPPHLANGKEKSLYKSNTASHIDVRSHHRKASDLAQRSSTSQCLLVVQPPPPQTSSSSSSNLSSSSSSVNNNKQQQLPPAGSSTDSLHSSSESLFVAGVGAKPRLPPPAVPARPPAPLPSSSSSASQQLSVMPETAAAASWRRGDVENVHPHHRQQLQQQQLMRPPSSASSLSNPGAAGGTAAAMSAVTLNQSRSENSLSVPALSDAEELRMLANRKISAPDCTEEASVVSGKYRADSGFLSVEENYAKKKKYSLETSGPPPSSSTLGNWNQQAGASVPSMMAGAGSSSASAIYPASDRSNASSRTASLRSLSSNEEQQVGPADPASGDQRQQQQQSSSSVGGGGGAAPQQQQHQASVLQVYAAYKTGLAAGTSVKLHVTSRTSAREVVDLVVQQLNMAVVLKGKGGPVYSVDQLKDFCLVAVIGARERCLRDDFQPLQLQNPWRKGRLFVRRKGDVLAALQHGHVSAQTSYL